MKRKLTPLPETVEVNHHSIVIRVYRRGDAGQWFATVSWDCIQTFKSDDWVEKSLAIIAALDWLKEAEERKRHDPR